MGNIQYWQTELYIKESWANFVRLHLTALEYRALGLPAGDLASMSDYLSIQDWPAQGSSDYSPIFIDLIDDINQGAAPPIAMYPNDTVTGYTPDQLNSFLLSSYGVSSLKANVKANKPTGIIDIQIDNLFKFYENKWL